MEGMGTFRPWKVRWTVRWTVWVPFLDTFWLLMAFDDGGDGGGGGADDDNGDSCRAVPPPPNHPPVQAQHRPWLNHVRWQHDSWKAGHAARHTRIRGRPTTTTAPAADTQCQRTLFLPLRRLLPWAVPRRGGQDGEPCCQRAG